MVRRLVAGLAGLALIAASCLALLFAFTFGLLFIDRPDPTVPDGDPCCGHPDTWGEVWGGIGSNAVVALAAGAALSAAYLLLVYAVQGRPRVSPRLAVPPGIAVGAYAVAAAAVLLPHLD